VRGAGLYVGQPGMTSRDELSPHRVVTQPRQAEPIEVRGPGHLVPVTTWGRSERPLPAQPDWSVGRYGGWTHSPYALGGLVVGVGVLATLVVCLVIALLALVAWVSAHALAVGVGIAAVVVTALMFLRALTLTRTRPGGGCCR
jgi:hypothetical protein